MVGARVRVTVALSVVAVRLIVVVITVDVGRALVPFTELSALVVVAVLTLAGDTVDRVV